MEQLALDLEATGAPEQDKARLSRHCRIILERLREGPMNTLELAEISKNHTARISNIRAYLKRNGINASIPRPIRSKEHEGVFIYRLEER